MTATRVTLTLALLSPWLLNNSASLPKRLVHKVRSQNTHKAAICCALTEDKSRRDVHNGLLCHSVFLVWYFLACVCVGVCVCMRTHTHVESLQQRLFACSYEDQFSFWIVLLMLTHLCSLLSYFSDTLIYQINIRCLFCWYCCTSIAIMTQHYSQDLTFMFYQLSCCLVLHTQGYWMAKRLGLVSFMHYYL